MRKKMFALVLLGLLVAALALPLVASANTAGGCPSGNASTGAQNASDSSAHAHAKNSVRC